MTVSINGTTGISGVDGSAATPALQGSDTNTGISFGTDEVAINTGGTARATIDSSGRLLVGTSTVLNFPNRASTAIGPSFVVAGTNAGTASAGVSAFYTDTSFAPMFTLAKSNNASVGSHTTVANDTALGELNFAGSNGSVFLTAASITSFVDGAVSGGGANDMPGRLVFSTTADGASSPTERMRIHSTGTVSCLKGLTIGDGFDAGSNKIYIAAAVITSGAGNSTLKYNTGTGIVTYDTSSRLVKENIVDCPYGIDALKQLQPRKYFRTDDQREEIGFVADEMVQVMPEFVPIGPKSVITKDENDTEQIPIGVNYEKLTAVLAKALQEAITRIETLEAEVQALKGGN